MKKLTGYFLCFAGMCVIFTACYYLSYQRVMKQFLEQTKERDYQLMTELKNSGYSFAGTEGNMAVPSGEPEEIVEAGTIDSQTIKPDATYILESYELSGNQLIREELALPGEYVGLTREEVIKKLSAYMQNVPVSEYEKGLFAYELLSFSGDSIWVRKSYNHDLVKYKYYVAVREGYVIVYYSDLKTVYEYTKILAIELPETERDRLMQGIYLNSNEELYELLESYSS